MPEPWTTRILIVSEAQNLSKTYGDYVERLRKLSDEDLFLRLYPEVRQRLYEDRRSTELGIAPWDDGPLPLAASAVWGQPPAAFALGNAVLWSATTDSNANQNPFGGPLERSVEIWGRFLQVLAPEAVVCVGGIAYDVIRHAAIDPGIQCVRWLSASPRVLNTFFGSWGQPNELEDRFPEIKRALVPATARSRKSWPAWVAYACHAISATPSNLRPRRG